MPTDPLNPTQFTRESAERIARVVRAAETTGPKASPLSFDKRFNDRFPKQIRAALFSGSWPIGNSKVVSFAYAPYGTVVATNLSWPIAAAGYSNEDCLIGREGNTWRLLVPRLEVVSVPTYQTAAGYVATQTASGVFATAGQTSVATIVSSTATRSFVTGVSRSTATIDYLTGVTVEAVLNTTDCTIAVVTNPTTASRSVVTGLSTTGTSITVANSFATAIVMSGNVSTAVFVTNGSTGAFIIGSAEVPVLRIRVP
ncbi:MAG: hypothetical protein FJ284_03440 [Planctomycetes bacterium]|nr:hypothetical protein [Planctomycetota bacterium]